VIVNYYTNYVTVNGDEINRVKVKVSYELGGRNYISGEMVKRGLWLYVMPLQLEEQKLSDGTKYHVERTQPFTWQGYRKLLKELNRKSDKTGKTMAKLVADEVANKHGDTWKLVEKVLEDNNLSLA
jgi:hypothetical protein